MPGDVSLQLEGKMKTNPNPHLTAFTIGAFLLVALACTCTCGPFAQLANVQATVSAIRPTAESAATGIGEALPTIEAAATGLGETLPTVQAEMTRIAQLVTENAPAYQGTMTAIVATADALAGVGQSTPGTVTGAVCYPSEMIPPMIIYAQNIATGALVELSHQTATQYTMTVPPGDYYFFAYTDFGSPSDEIPGGYTGFLFCSAAPKECPHDLITVHVEAGWFVEGIDICDWYFPPGDTSIPPNPKGQ